jgi:hypothetical protein
VTLPLALESPSIPVEWRESHKGHARFLALADRHYTRQQPGTNQACRPGKNLVLLTTDGSAAWCVWRPLPEVGRMDNLWAWECTLYRNEGQRRSSDLIREATAFTYRAWGWPPRDGLITAVGIEPTREGRRGRNFAGWCFRKAGWTHTHDKDGKAWFRAPLPERTAKPSTGKE